MLKGQNIVLRPLEASDIYLLDEIENSSEYWEFGSEKKKYSRQELADYILNAKTDISVAKQYRFVIDFNKIPIGFIDLFDYNVDSAGIGIIIAKEYRNKGFAKEAVILLSNYAFLVLGIMQLKVSVSKSNILSIKLFDSCGFEFKKEDKDLQYFIKLAD